MMVGSVAFLGFEALESIPCPFSAEETNARFRSFPAGLPLYVFLPSTGSRPAWRQLLDVRGTDIIALVVSVAAVHGASRRVRCTHVEIPSCAPPYALRISSATENTWPCLAG
jgi:hypothetical protein